MNKDDLRLFVQHALDEFNQRFPRPKMKPLVSSDPFDILEDWDGKYPNSDLPGVYLFFDQNGQLLYVGKASCSNVIGGRLGSYFKFSDDKTHGVAKDKKAEGARYIVSVGIPEKGRAFETPAVEEYLITKLTPPRNSVGKG